MATLTRILLVVAVTSTLTLGFIAAPAAAQTQRDFWNASNRTFFLHLAQYCDRDTALIRWIDEFDWGNDLDGCGGNIADPAAEWTDTFPLYVPLYANVTASTTAEMHIFVLSRAVDQTSVEATFDLGYAKCTGASPTETLTSSRATGFHEFVIPCAFEVGGTPNPLARANLTITVTATHTYGYGTEGDHASFVTLAGVTPAPPKDEVQFFEQGQRPLVQFAEEDIEFVALEPASAPAKSPAPGGALAFLSVALVAVAASWMRRR